MYQNSIFIKIRIWFLTMDNNIYTTQAFNSSEMQRIIIELGVK